MHIESKNQKTVARKVMNIVKKATGVLVTGVFLLTTTAAAAEDRFPYVTTPMEYTLYENIFYNDQISAFEGQKMMKVGTYSSIYDSFSQVKRYYVWGYNDETKCCDWQWEFVPESEAELPPEGSLIELTGTFTADEAALDGCWLTDVSFKVKTPWVETDKDVDMSTMSATLERVQLINMSYYPEDYEGKTVAFYGRVENIDTIQHPYYDGVWSQQVETADPLPAIGMTVLAEGTFTAGTVVDAIVTETQDY